MKVLSIDIDYIMSNSCNLYGPLFRGQNAKKGWSDIFNNTDLTERHLVIDQSNLMFAFNAFLSALKSNPKVRFGYEHDAILFDLKDETDIEIINIDHHNDIFHGNWDYIEEYEIVRDHEVIKEGNWGIWLIIKEKLKKWTWIGNNSSVNWELEVEKTLEFFQDYERVLKEDYTFEDYNFDYVYVCLSPQYIPQGLWHYFAMFMSAYEHYSGNDAIIHQHSYGHSILHKEVNNEILYKRTDGRGPVFSSGL